MPDATGDRPGVTVVVPFFGDPTAAKATLRTLAGVRTCDGDEVVAVDNSLGGALLAQAEGRACDVRVVPSPVKRSAYAARNVGAEQARNAWLLFLDADCRPAPGLLDAYFEEPIGGRIGALGGEIFGNEAQPGIAARFARSRGLLGIDWNRTHPHMPIAVTANMLVRRDAWAAVGGFAEGMRAAAGDVDLAWRLQEAGWELDYRPGAMVEHDHRETLRALLRQTARNGAGAAWLNRRRPGSVRRPRLAGSLARSLIGTVGFAATGRLERAAFKGIDGLFVLAGALGRLADNAPPEALGIGADTVAVISSFPDRDGESLAAIEALAGGQLRVRVEAAERASRPDWRRGRRLPARFREDEGPASRTMGLLWLAGRHPVRAARDAVIRRPRGSMPTRALASTARRIAAAAPATLTAIPGDDPGLQDARRLSRLTGIPLADRQGRP